MDRSSQQVPSSSRNSSSRSSRNPSQQLSQIEKSVTHLLIATKQLLETLTSWSRRQATDKQVSDVYVLLGYEFNLACRAFTSIGVETSDLGNVPEILRAVLEDTLSQDATPQTLDRYLPKIRDIIIDLLQGLKKKQQRLRSKQTTPLPSNAPGHVPRQGSVASTGSGETSLTRMLEEGTNEVRAGIAQRDQYDRRKTTDGNTEQVKVPYRTSSSTRRRARSPHHLDGTERRSRREAQRSGHASPSSSLSSATLQNIPVIAPPEPSSPEQLPPPSRSIPDSFPPPPPPPKQQDALAALQRGGELERRASRRYSQYQISKHIGSAVPMLPSSERSSTPNRKDNRESFNAVRMRGSMSLSQMRTRSSSQLAPQTSTGRLPSRISEENFKARSSVAKSAKNEDASGNATNKAPTDKYLPSQPPTGPLPKPPGVELNLPTVPELPTIIESKGKEPEKALPKTPTPEERGEETNEDDEVKLSTPTGSRTRFTPESSPSPGKELTLFLQYKSKVKKFVLTGGYSELTLARLQLAFIEKFAWNTHNNGRDLPEIYIQDPMSGIRHELEDLSDVKDRSVLVLNIEVLDEVKSHIDDGIGDLKRILDSVRSAVESQESNIQHVTSLQQDTAKELAKLAAAPPPIAVAASGSPGVTRTISLPTTTSRTSIIAKGGNGDLSDLSEVQALRRDLAVIRQSCTNFTEEMASSMASVRAKTESVKEFVRDAGISAGGGGEVDSGRAYVNTGRDTLENESNKLVTRVDDLQDVVEDLRKDVCFRGVRPLPRQLEVVSKDIAVAQRELKKMQSYLKREKPQWTKIWEKELDRVCQDRDFLGMQEELVVDLEDDLEKATQTFGLVEAATKQQNLTGQPSGNPAPVLRSPSRTLGFDANGDLVDPVKAKDEMLDEVRALQPNHEGRLEAIERAEKARQRELEQRRGGEFQKELRRFVEDGGLKKSGGFEEVERQRKLKEDKIRQEVWDRLGQGRVIDPDGVADQDVVRQHEEEHAGMEEDDETNDEEEYETTDEEEESEEEEGESEEEEEGVEGKDEDGDEREIATPSTPTPTQDKQLPASSPAKEAKEAEE